MENFKNIPRSPYGGRQGSNVIFFLLQICNKVPGEKKRGGLSPPNGRYLKLPVDQEYAIRQSFAGFLLLTPLLFPEFLGSNDKGNGCEWWPGFKIGGREPVAPPTGDRGLSPLGWATGACRPLGGRQTPFFFFSRDFVANLKKNYI